MDAPNFLENIPALRVGARLSEQLAEALVVSIRDGQLPSGERLPTESALVQRFGVSRTVVREALSRLKTMGLIESRQGSGAFVKNSFQSRVDQLVLAPDGSVNAVIQMVEMRRALEAESAALAASRRTPADIKNIKDKMAALDRAVALGGDGVEEDVALHTAIATAANNPFLLATLAYLSQFLRDATRVTRANESTRCDFAQQVRDEHTQIVKFIEAGDATAARMAGAMHMVNAAQRIARADPAFWAQQGVRLADRLRSELGAPQPPRKKNTPRK
jgi:GntR family transcriptional repressor for pyruvate dehydrogenase complex